MRISVRNERTLRRAIDHYGRAAQLVKCIEEMNEWKAAGLRIFVCAPRRGVV